MRVATQDVIDSPCPCITCGLLPDLFRSPQPRLAVPLGLDGKGTTPPLKHNIKPIGDVRDGWVSDQELVPFVTVDAENAFSPRPKNILICETRPDQVSNGLRV